MTLNEINLKTFCRVRLQCALVDSMYQKNGANGRDDTPMRLASESEHGALNFILLPRYDEETTDDSSMQSSMSDETTSRNKREKGSRRESSNSREKPGERDQSSDMADGWQEMLSATVQEIVGTPAKLMSEGKGAKKQDRDLVEQWRQWDWKKVQDNVKEGNYGGRAEFVKDVESVISQGKKALKLSGKKASGKDMVRWEGRVKELLGKVSDEAKMAVQGVSNSSSRSKGGSKRRSAAAAAAAAEKREEKTGKSEKESHLPWDWRLSPTATVPESLRHHLDRLQSEGQSRLLLPVDEQEVVTQSTTQSGGRSLPEQFPELSVSLPVLPTLAVMPQSSADNKAAAKMEEQSSPPLAALTSQSPLFRQARLLHAIRSYRSRLLSRVIQDPTGSMFAVPTGPAYPEPPLLCPSPMTDKAATALLAPAAGIILASEGFEASSGAALQIFVDILRATMTQLIGCAQQETDGSPDQFVVSDRQRMLAAVEMTSIPGSISSLSTYLRGVQEREVQLQGIVKGLEQKLQQLVGDSETGSTTPSSSVSISNPNANTVDSNSSYPFRAESIAPFLKRGLFTDMCDLEQLVTTPPLNLGMSYALAVPESFLKTDDHRGGVSAQNESLLAAPPPFEDIVPAEQIGLLRDCLNRNQKKNAGLIVETIMAGNDPSDDASHSSHSNSRGRGMGKLASPQKKRKAADDGSYSFGSTLGRGQRRRGG